MVPLTRRRTRLTRSARPCDGFHMSTIRIPPVLREHTGGNRTVEVAGRTVSEALADLFRRHPGLGDQLTDQGELSRFINVYVNDRDVRYGDGLDTSIGADDTIIILPAMAGGTR